MADLLNYTCAERTVNTDLTFTVPLRLALGAGRGGLRVHSQSDYAEHVWSLSQT